MAQKIVVGVDGSETSQIALGWAAGHARRRGATLEVMSTWQPPGDPMTPMGMAYIPPSTAELETHARERMDAMLEAAAAELEGIEVEAVVTKGDASRVLCKAAEEAELLVLGSRGLGGFKGLVLGSVSARCANASPCPIAIIPPGWSPSAEPKGTISVGVDGSENSLAAVRWIDGWAPPEATIRVVSAWSYPVAYTRAEIEFDDAALEAACEQTVATAAELVEHHTVEPRTIKLDARLALGAEANEADILVLGARGHSGFFRLLLGSVASSVIHHLTIPTILVRAEADADDD